MKPYDFLVVGAGFFGSVFSRLMTDHNRRCLVIESRDHIGGNAYTKNIEGIDVHVYGAHIFHTENTDIWNFVNKFASFNCYHHCPKAFSNKKLYSLPFNLNTFNQIWGCVSPESAKKIIDQQRLKLDRPADNLEEQALSLVGSDIYELLIKQYTQKQWGKHPKDLPAFIIKRLPLRFTFDDCYFNDRYQGIPIGGYTQLFEKMLSGIEVKLNTDYFEQRDFWNNQADTVVYTGAIDRFFDYQFGKLEYRTLDFRTETINQSNYQGTAVINYCDSSVPWTRVIEHKHFAGIKSDNTVITKEIPAAWTEGSVPYYPVNDLTNNQKYQRYRELAEQTKHVVFGGRLAEYQYYDMHQVIGSAMKKVKGIIQ
jgi:UDP-galactopyranose mutase